jgi:hypothetical protein
MQRRVRAGRCGALTQLAQLEVGFGYFSGFWIA